MDDGTAARSVEVMLMARSFLGGLNEGMPEPVIRRFAALTRELFFREGTVIYEEGDSPDHIYFVIDGRIRLDTEGLSAWRFGRYSVFGILDAQLGRPHSRTATAETDIRVMAVLASDWFALIEDNFELTRLALVRNAASLWSLTAEGSRGALIDGQRRETSEQITALAARVRRRGSLNPFERLLALRLSPLFSRARMQPLIRLAQGAEVGFLEEGELLFQQGESVDALLFVASGVVTVEQLEAQHSATFRAGDLVGSFAALGLDSYPFDARAASDAVVLAIHLDDLYDVMEDHFDVVQSLQAYLALERERIQEVNIPEATDHPSLLPPKST